MIQDFIITFRETLEIALIVGIILGYLARTGQAKYNKTVYIGIISAVIASIIGAILFVALAGGFEGRAEQIFEGITMLVGALLLTTMILWMMKQKHIAKELEQKVKVEISEAHKFGLFLIVFVSVLREGIETVIFLGAASFLAADRNFIWALGGIIAAIFLGYLIFLGSMRINIKTFFNITSILLILFAAGLVASSSHEFEEAGIINPVIEHVWDINPSVNPDGSFPLLHEKGYIGSILKGLVGYDGNPSLMMMMSWLVYILIVFGLWKNIERVHEVI